MKSTPRVKAQALSAPAIPFTLRSVAARLSSAGSAPSIDALDAAIRGFGVAIVLLLSLVGYGRSGERFFLDIANPLFVAAGLVLYNVLVITVVGVPWRHTPGFQLFLFDWLIASAAILLTGGFLSPFNILYYALIIGAALRIGLRRSSALVVGCAALYFCLSVLDPDPLPAARLPILVVQISSLAMVMFMSVGMKRAVEVEERKVDLEERTTGQLRLLNNLTNTVLSGSPDLEHVVRTIASASSAAVEADSGLAILFDQQLEVTPDLSAPEELLIVADRDHNPVTLSPREMEVLNQAVSSQQPVLVCDASNKHGHTGICSYPGLSHNGEAICTVACVPFLLNHRALGALLVGRHTDRQFTSTEVDLLTAISQQMAVAVRLAHIYEMEREKAARSEERERLERDLLSMVSHELRTPLTSIKTCVGALSDSSSGVGGHSAIETSLVNNIGRSTDRLIGLVNELLDMARLRAGRVTLNRQELNMGEVLVEAATQVRPLLDVRTQALTIDLPAADSPRWQKLNVLADRRRIEQVIVNLLSNANRYGPHGSRIVLGATQREGTVKVFVRDEGPGIARHEQGLVFDKFYQGSSAVGGTTRPDSTGLGLAIARSIVELHGGQIGVYSKLGSGSTFYFTLPFLDRQAGLSTAPLAGPGKEN